MCEQCLSDAVSFTSPIYIGEDNKDPSEVPDGEWNNYLNSRESFSVMVATKEYEHIKKNAILFVHSNDPSFVFNVMPPKDESGNYIFPETDEEFEKLSDASLDAHVEYGEYIKNIIKSGPIHDIARLFKVYEKMGVSTTDYHVIDEIYKTLIEASKKIEAGDYKPVEYSMEATE